MTKTMKNEITAKGHKVYNYNSTSDYIKLNDGTQINIRKIATGLYLVWGPFNNMVPEGMTASMILALI